MTHELFSEKYYDYRTRLAKDIAYATEPFVAASVERRDQAQATVSDNEIIIQGMRYGIGVRYIAPDSDPSYQRLHRFTFTYGGGLSYLTTRLNSLRSPELLNSIEAIAENEEALNQLAWMSTAILSSHLAKRRQYPEDIAITS